MTNDIWPDNETAEDLFGFQVHADLVRAVVLTPQMQPVTVGVFDDSGSKTRIMQILERDLSPENWKEGSLEAIRCRNAAVVYINTWQFEGCDDAKGRDSALRAPAASRFHKRHESTTGTRRPLPPGASFTHLSTFVARS